MNSGIDKIIFVAKSGTSREPMAAGIMNEFVLKKPVEILARGLVVYHYTDNGIQRQGQGIGAVSGDKSRAGVCIIRICW